MANKKVLVMGATGFIGRNIVERLCGRDDLELYGTYFRTKPPEPLAGNSKIELIQADLTARDAVEQAVAGKDIVIQAAAVTTGARDTLLRPYIHVTDNAVMNALIFRAAFESKVRQVIFFSCTSMYSEQKKPVREEDFDSRIIDKYFGVGWTKVYNEKMCEFYSRISKTMYAAIRHSNIYGPHDKFDLDRSHVFGATVTKVMTANDGKVVVWGDGSEKRDLLYISDLVDFVELLMERQQTPFELVNLGCGNSVSIKQLVEKIIEVSGREIAIEYDLGKPTIGFNLTLDVRKAQTTYGWQSRISLKEGIQRTLSWYKENIRS